MFRKLEFQTWWGIAKWLYRYSTAEEKAYILTNQFAMKGQNDGTEELPLQVVTDFPRFGIKKTTVNNKNTAIRHIYVHGTNRIDQLGKALSGGCVRISNLSTYLLANIYRKQGAVPVFIDAIKLYEGTDPTEPEIVGVKPGKNLYINSLITYRTIQDVDFTDNERSEVLKNRLDDDVILPLLEKISYSKDTIYLKISSSLPFPEGAMRNWLEYQDSLELIETDDFRYTFDIAGNYYAGNEIHDPILEKKITVDKAKDIVKNRVVFTQNYISQSVKKHLSGTNIDTTHINKRIVFVEETVKMKGRNSKRANLGFDINGARLRALYYLCYLDSVAEANPTYFAHKDLTWIKSYLKTPKQFFYANAGGKNHAYVVTYHDALLAQAYLYAIGEQEFREEAYKRKMIPTRGATDLHQIYNDKEWLLEQFDRLGRQKLAKHSHTATKLNYRFATDNMKENSQRILGIILEAEEILSKEKVFANILRIEEVPPPEALAHKN
jgi:hypothetical protein